MKKYACLLIIVCFFSNSQDLNLLKSFGVHNPLSYQFVRTIAQDKDGFMWFGSQEGLHRYDGYQFLSFHHDASDPNSLSSDLISRILIDSTNQLWVATSGDGLNVYRESSKNFQHISTRTEKLKLVDDNINAILEDSLGNIWIGTENGLNIIFRDSETWRVHTIKQELGNPKSLSHSSVKALLQTSDNQIWVGTNGGGVSVFDLQGNFIKAVKLIKDKSAGNKTEIINALFQDQEGSIWIGTVESGLIKYRADKDKLTHYQFKKGDIKSLSSNTIEAIYQDSNDRLWVATDKGALIYNVDSDKFWRFNHSASNPYSLTNDYVLTFFEDKSHMMWIGTYSGVNRWDPNMTTFSQYNDQRFPEITNSLITGFTQIEDEHLVFSSYDGGIYQLNIKNNEVSELEFNQHFKDLRVTNLYADHDELWVGTRSSGLFNVNLKTYEIKNYRHDNLDTNSISANSVTDIIKDSHGTIWVSTWHKGINRFNDDGTFTQFEMKESSPLEGPSSNHIVQIIEDRTGYFWLATYGGGLNRFNTKTEKFVHLKHDDNIPDSISSDLAWIIFEDEDENLWVGTQTAGFNILSKENLDKNNFSFSHLNLKDGMKSRAVYGIIQDDNGDIWFSSNKGISRYSPAHQSFKHFDTSHGLVDLEYNQGTVFKGSDKTLYFGSAKGFIGINPENISKNRAAPEVKLTNILKLNEPMVFEQSIASLNSLIFDYSDQLISFEYVGLNYSDPESTIYKYRLLGFDQEWIDAGKSRRATYTNLPAGSYQLQVIAGNSDNIWSEPGYSLDITVNPAPWNTWWAYVFYAMAVALILLVYSRFLNRKLLVEQQQKTYLKEQVKEKTQKYQSKNSELEQANKLLEKAATIDKITGVRSRRYLDIYIEQTSQLMKQIHHNILPVQRSTLPRLYVLMVQLNELSNISDSQLVNVTDLLLYSRNTDDLVVRWSEDTFAVIGYEKDNNAGELAVRLAERFLTQFDKKIAMNIAYSFYPFNLEQPMDISWDQVSVMIELGLNIASKDPAIAWFGLCEPKVQPFNYLHIIQDTRLASLKQHIQIKQG